jgi:RNA polymerase sigma-70 factor (ECF subfamily)
MQTAEAPIIPRPLPTGTFTDDLLKAVPKLRAYAASLSRVTGRADDLVQETLAKALANIRSFEPGSNMMAWLYTILRNEFYSEYRKRRLEVDDDESRHADRARVFPSQEGHLYFLNVRDAFDKLAAEHREALTLVASGFTYKEAAAAAGCAVGTVKSRTSRARDRLARMLNESQSWTADNRSSSGTPCKAITFESALPVG